LPPTDNAFTAASGPAMTHPHNMPVTIDGVGEIGTLLAELGLGRN
jgi:lactate dehydrogenase-like 2-hydroxyacid dehydrogenase